MKRFCTQCGKEAKQDHKVCIHCGTPLQANHDQVKEEKSETKQNKVTKQPMTKKQKLIWKVIAGVIVFIIGFSMWANSYQSPESVQKRFEKAVENKDSKKLSRLMIHGDGSSISQHEAEAFINLMDQKGANLAFELAHVVQKGKFLGIYDAHKMEAVDQLANGYFIDGLSYTFNGEEVDEYERNEDSITFGPLAPGIYEVQAQFDGEYGDITIEDSVILNSYMYHDYTWMDIEIPISDVVFFVENYELLDVSTAYVQIDDQKFSISDEGTTDAIGPMNLDGSQQVTVVVDMPWGEVESEPFEVDDSYMSIYADLVSPDQFEGALTVIEDFGEQYVQSMAENSTKPFTTVSTDVKEYMTSRFDDYYSYSGKLETIGIDKRSLFVESDDNEPVVYLPVQYIVQDDYHDLTETPNLTENYLTWRMGLTFDPDDEEWLITTIEESGMWGGFEATDEWKGSGEMYGPSEEAIEKAEEQALENNLEAFIKDYTQASVDAINYRDFDLVSNFISEDGPRRKEARDYIDYLDSKDIYESWYGSELEKVKNVDDNTWEVTVIEEFEINKPDSSDVKKFRTVLIIKQIDDHFYVDELTETNEI